MQWKMFWTLFGAALSLCAAAIPTLYGVTFWIAVIVVAVSVVAMMIASGRIVNSANMFSAMRCGQRDQIATFVRLGIVAYGMWTTLFLAKPAYWVLYMALLPVVGLAVYWGARGVEYKISREKPLPVVEAAQRAESEIPGDPEVMRNFRSVLGRAGHSSVKILRHSAVMNDAGNVDANQFLIQTPATNK